MTNDKQPDIDNLMKEFYAAAEELEIASAKERAASSAECEARNRLNIAQKALDAYFEQLQKKAPWNTHWHEKRKHGRRKDNT